MHLQAVLQPVRSLAADVPARWRSLRLPYKVAAAASLLALASMVHLGIVVAGHVRGYLVQQSAAAAALHMDSFVASHVQELATRSSLSESSKDALQRLLSPASMHRPVVAFRIWKGDTITFSNDRELSGKTFERTAMRNRAWEGHVVAELARPDGDDNEQIKSLDVPVLEIYAPVREDGTGRIIALVEIYEIAVALERDVLMRQIASWTAVAAIALTIVLLLFSIANSGAIERSQFTGRIAELSFLQQRSEEDRLRMSYAGMQVSHMNERSLHSLGAELQEGPGQLVALAMLKFDALDQLMADLSRSMPSRADERARDLEAIRKALGDTLGHIQRVAGNLLVGDIETLTVPEVLARAVRQLRNKSGMAIAFEADALTEHLPLPVKACLYRLAVEGLDIVCASLGSDTPRLSASCEGERMVLQFAGLGPALDTEAGQAKISGLRNRIEAVGGQFRIDGAPPAGRSLVAELWLSRMLPDG